VIGRRPGTIAALVAVAIGALPVKGVFGAGNFVPASLATRYQAGITANTLKPVECAGITLTTVVAGNTGTGGADLLLGSSAVNSMSGGNGDDCILGGGGNDSINCGAGTDVAVGGPGTDTFNANCETRIQ
jgi:Ca2+-binding RTX toxin-like protein